MLDLQKILGFTRLLNKFRQVRRTIRVNSEERLENDVEHSYYLGMLAWYIADSHNLSLDKDLVLKYALVHDVELAEGVGTGQAGRQGAKLVGVEDVDDAGHDLISCSHFQNARYSSAEGGIHFASGTSVIR